MCKSAAGLGSWHDRMSTRCAHLLRRSRRLRVGGRQELRGLLEEIVVLSNTELRFSHLAETQARVTGRRGPLGARGMACQVAAAWNGRMGDRSKRRLDH